MESKWAVLFGKFSVCVLTSILLFMILAVQNLEVLRFYGMRKPQADVDCKLDIYPEIIKATKGR